MVVTELLSNPLLPPAARKLIELIPRLELHDGYWVRAGVMRAELKSISRKANLPDVLIAQSCIDHDVPLITYDRDFRHFRDAGLILI